MQFDSFNQVQSLSQSGLIDSVEETAKPIILTYTARQKVNRRYGCSGIPKSVILSSDEAIENRISIRMHAHLTSYRGQVWFVGVRSDRHRKS